MKEIVRYLLGYLIGFLVFIIAMPYAFYGLSTLDDAFFRGYGIIDSETVRTLLFALLFGVGVVFAAWSNLELLNVGKGGPADAFGVSISPQTKHLVTSGPYALCQNPMLFGAILLYASLVVFFNSLTGLLVLIALVFVATRTLHRSEEKRLHKDFGEEYLRYKARVPLLFPFRFRKRNQ
jgi:protein-S-isoprenylcysteine O-methyltransferase Ste14